MILGLLNLGGSELILVLALVLILLYVGASTVASETRTLKGK